MRLSRSGKRASTTEGEGVPTTAVPTTAGPVPEGPEGRPAEADTAATTPTTRTGAVVVPPPPKRRRLRAPSLQTWRKVLAQLLWLLFVLAAGFLAVGALLIAVDANADNDLVAFVLDAADALDLGVFSVDNGVMKFDGANAETKNALFNWGLGAIAWLVVGRLVDRLVRP
ncbi:hypothetical protein [Nocardioides sp. SYSU D00038]|uniref:hypothetical protein n=1 Tax=Nocardioides sp. SYSU D00038 TaxID=2812554 RepID=UPI001F07ACFC|nr:hypothetical protein [Nocardioides sp. SYSU D00038]